MTRLAPFTLLLAVTAHLVHAETPAPSLRELAAPYFQMGAALEHAHLASPEGRAQDLEGLLGHQFATLTHENSMKWESLQPREGEFTFEQADALIAVAERNNPKLDVVGHTLVWHHQTPKWVFENADREKLLARMRTHIHTVVGRYRGRVKGWDVVNEALDGDGELRRKSPWVQIIGPDFIEHAFRFAHEADPDAELYYNDYGLEGDQKRAGALRIVKRLKDAGLRIDGVGLQGHYGTNLNTRAVEKSILDFYQAGVQAMFTELDISVLPRAWGNIGADISANFEKRAALDPYTNGLPAEVAQHQARVYGELFSIFVRHHEKISRVTFWGLQDGLSWLNHWPVRGRTDHPLLFDRNAQTKPAFHAVVEALKAKDSTP